MANVATLALREKRGLDDLLAADFLAFVAEKETELKEHGYERVPCFVECEHWWRAWYEDDKKERHAAVTAKWQGMMDRKYEWIWRQQFRFAAARQRVLAEDGMEEATQTFFVTVRPATERCTFREFYEKVKDVVERKAFQTWTLSFEQKGLTDADLGNGFHVHIVAKTTFRSKPEVLRALLGTHDDNKQKWMRGTLSSWINDEKLAENCVDVQVCKNPRETTEKYLVKYESKDGHKLPTKVWDDKWRVEQGLQPLYTSDDGLGHLPIKSNRQVVFEV